MKFVFLILFLLFFGSAYSLDSQDLLNGAMVSQTDSESFLEGMIFQNNLTEIDRLLRVYQANFADIDIPLAYYNTGMKFYTNQQKNLALKAFLRGYQYYSTSASRLSCGLYAVKIFYQNGNRNSALFYINRLLEKSVDNKALTGELLKLKRRVRWEYVSTYEGLKDDSISDLEFDGDDVWIALWTGGIARFTRSSMTMQPFFSGTSGLISEHTRDIKVFQGKVWVATFDGLCSYNKKTGGWDREDGKIGQIPMKRLREINGSLYAATLGKGLFKLDNTTGEWKAVFTDAANITDVIFADGKLFISALDQGIFVIQGRNIKNLLPGISVKTLAVRNGIIFAGTHGKGIFMLDQGGRVLEQYDSGYGFPADYIETIEPVPAGLLVGTLETGAIMFKPELNSWKVLTVLDGLPSNDVVRIAVEKNKIWFGTLSGGVGILMTEKLGDL